MTAEADAGAERIDRGARSMQVGLGAAPRGARLPRSLDRDAQRDLHGSSKPLAAPSRSRMYRRGEEGTESNARLTASAAVVLFILFAAEGVTILQVRGLLTAHVFIGMLLIPPVLLKIASTGWRFARYYLGNAAYRRKGPPPLLLRLLGPVVVVLTVAVLATGVALLLGPVSWRSQMLFLHKATFVVWLMALAVHVLGHLLDTARLAPLDWMRRSRRQVRGASLRQWTVAGSIAVGLVLAALVVPKVGPWLAAGAFGPHG